MHFKKYLWEVRFIDDTINEVASDINEAIKKAKIKRIKKRLNSMVISARKVEKWKHNM